MATDPWADFEVVTPSQNGPTYGPPPKAPAPPSEVEMERLRIAQAGEKRAEVKAAREEAEWNATHNPDGSLKPKPAEAGGKPTESERTAAFLATRLATAANQIGAVDNLSAASPSMGVEAVRSVFGDTAANYLTGEDRQRIEAAQIDFIDSALTLGTGAAYTAEQLAGYRKSFFPVLGDSEATIRDKRARLEGLMQAARVKAGNAAPDIDRAVAAIFPQAQNPAATEENSVPNDRYAPGYRDGGLVGSVTDDSPAPPPPPVHPLTAGIGDMVQGVGDLAGIVVNPVNAGINAVAGTNIGTDLGSYLRDDLLQIPHGDPMYESINRNATAAFAGAGGARSLAQIANPGAWKSALGVIGEAPMADMIAGGAAGAGSQMAENAGMGPVGQTLAAIAAGAPVVAARTAMMRGPSAPSDLAQAASRQGVDLMAADTGRPWAASTTSGLAQSPVSAGTIRNAANRNQSQLQDATERAARSEAPAVGTDVAGEGVRKGAERYSRETSSRGGVLYERAEKAAQGVQITPQQALQKIDEQIARLSETPGSNSGTLSELQTLRDDLAGGVSVMALRDLRSNLRGRTNGNGQLRSDQQQFMLGEIVDRLSDDVDAGLRAAGREGAARMFRRADDFWKQRVEQIDQVLQPIVGRDKGGEQIVSTLEAMAKGTQGGSKRLSRMMASMTPDEQANVRATLIDRMGRATPGQQDAEGAAFSASTFLTNWNRMTPQAKATLFQGELRSNLDDIAKIAEGSKEAMRFANSSNTGGANAVQGITTLGGYGVAGMAGGLKGLAAAAALQYGSAKLLASPKFAQWLAKAPATNNPNAMRAYVNRLGVIAAREPAIAADARNLQQQLQQSFGQSPTRAAASEEEQN